MISYKNIYEYSVPGRPGRTGSDGLGDIHRFRRVDRSGFNVTDQPDQRYFKLFFYFYNNPDEGDNSRVDFYNGGNSGLLAPTWLDNPSSQDYYKYNSAWAYLKNNFEDERASALENFITLLSTISSESPWYFKEVVGVDEALVRDKWTVGDERKKITINCITDSIDKRIESLLSLYRSIVWSHTRKCEVLPSNLRKFDMGLFVVSGLYDGLTVMQDKEGNQTGWADIGKFNLLNDRGSYKYIEFRNCEINMDSIKSGYSSLNNEEGFAQDFAIDIYFDDCYEYEFNPFLASSFGDYFVWDSQNWNITTQSWYVMGNIPVMQTNINDDMNKRINYSGQIAEKDPNSNVWKIIQKTAINKLESAVKNFKDTAIGGVGLGNIFGQGIGIAGFTEGVQQEINDQARLLQSKLEGNINDATNRIIKGATDVVKKPVMGTINAAASSVSDLIDQATDTITRPVLGTLNTMESFVSDTIDSVTGYKSRSEEYLLSESKKLGNIAYNNQSEVAGQIGKNRLNSLKNK